jgi:hypothetical protein
MMNELEMLDETIMGMAERKKKYEELVRQEKSLLERARALENDDDPAAKLEFGRLVLSAATIHNGLEEISAFMDSYARVLEHLTREAVIPMHELFDAHFMMENTSFMSFVQMLDDAAVRIESDIDYKALETERWSSYIIGHTSFAGWHDMERKALHSILALTRRCE